MWPEPASLWGQAAPRQFPVSYGSKQGAVVGLGSASAFLGLLAFNMCLAVELNMDIFLKKTSLEVQA